MSIYTKTGDEGETQRIDGRRVRKSDPFLEAEGTLDELNSHLGLCVAEALRLSKDKNTAKVDFGQLVASLQDIQRQLFALGTLLGGVEVTRNSAITQKIVEQMEVWIDKANQSLPRLRHFILPDGGELSARLHVARTVCRRAERAIVRLADSDQAVPPIALQYINRLSDLLFVAARTANAKLGMEEQKL